MLENSTNHESLSSSCVNLLWYFSSLMIDCKIHQMSSIFISGNDFPLWEGRNKVVFLIEPPLWAHPSLTTYCAGLICWCWTLRWPCLDAHSSHCKCFLVSVRKLTVMLSLDFLCWRTLERVFIPDLCLSALFFFQPCDVQQNTPNFKRHVHFSCVIENCYFLE